MSRLLVVFKKRTNFVQPSVKSKSISVTVDGGGVGGGGGGGEGGAMRCVYDVSLT